MLDISDGSRALSERAAVKMGSEVIEPAESQARRNYIIEDVGKRFPGSWKRITKTVQGRDWNEN